MAFREEHRPSSQPIYPTDEVENALFVTVRLLMKHASLIRQCGAILAFSDFQVPKSTNRAAAGCCSVDSTHAGALVGRNDSITGTATAGSSGARTWSGEGLA
jgi:hypothetical protein